MRDDDKDILLMLTFPFVIAGLVLLTVFSAVNTREFIMGIMLAFYLGWLVHRISNIKQGE